MNPELLWVFIPTIAAISLTPGMCMTLAFTLGLSQGYRRTLWMMWGELAGVATVVSTCVLLLAWIQSLSGVYFAPAGVGGRQLLVMDRLPLVDPARPLLKRRKPTASVSQRVAHLGICSGRNEPQGLGVHDCAVAGLHVRGVLNAAAARRVSGRDATLRISINDALCHGRERSQAIPHY